jgi:serine phosphatase RsbU (regulator of sigma subunit)
LETVEIGPGRQLVGYTDGVTEMAGDAERFEVDRLREAVAPSRGPAGAIRAIELALEEFGNAQNFDDDVTLLAIGRAPQLLEATGEDTGLGH